VPARRAPCVIGARHATVGKRVGTRCSREDRREGSLLGSRNCPHNAAGGPAKGAPHSGIKRAQASVSGVERAAAYRVVRRYVESKEQRQRCRGCRGHGLGRCGPGRRGPWCRNGGAGAETPGCNTEVVRAMLAWFIISIEGVEDVDDAERRGVKDVGGAAGVDEVYGGLAGLAGVKDVGRDAGRDDRS